MQVKLSIIKKTDVLGNEEFYLMFGDTYVPGSLCFSMERAQEMFEDLKNKVKDPIRQEVYSEYIEVSPK